MSVEISVAYEVTFMADIMKQIDKASCSIFNAKKSLRMELTDYLHRIQTYSECHVSCFTMAMILIDRVMEGAVTNNKSLPFNIYT